MNTQNFFKHFWNSEFWLMPGTHWKDIQPKDDYDYTDYRHLYLFPIPLAGLMLLFRYALEKYCFCRLGLSLGMKNIKCKKAPPNPVFERAYKVSNKWNHKDVVSLSKQTDCTERQVERWLRLRRMQEKPTTIFKFSESCWRCFYYSNVFIYGIISFSSELWFTNLDYCWINYPHQELSAEIWWFYMISLAFYLSMFTSQTFDSKRRDLWFTRLQHIMIIVFLMTSWISNFYRIGVVVLILHDISDALEQAGKAAKYAKGYKFCTYIYFIFLIVWTVTRLIMYPAWILRSALFRGPTVFQHTFPAYYFLNGLLIWLFLIHVYKSYLLVKLFFKTLTVDKVNFIS